MKILFLTFYYPPDLCAGSFRAQPLVRALLKEGGAGSQLDVITTMPNRYHTHNQAAPEREASGKVRIRRIGLPAHQSGMLDQAKAFLAYARGVRAEVRGGRWDIVVATSSRLMTGALGAHVARQTGAKLYLDVRDLFTDTMDDVLRGSPLKVLLPLFRGLERRTLNHASRVNLVSPGFLSHVSAIAPQHEYRLFTNGIDDEFLQCNFMPPPRPPGQPLLVVYAGNMGEGQGLHGLFPEAARALAGKARFRLIGDGGRRKQLEQALSTGGVTNVEILNPVPRKELLRHYDEADVLFTHLNDYPAFRNVLPSKLFEYAATGRRILAGVAGVSADFLRTQVSGAAVFAPLDVPAMVAAVEQVGRVPVWTNRSAFVAKYSRRNIMKAMAEDILALGPRP
jgi:hypothetical protein